MKRAIVLSGGGARGAYQVGVWKALRKLGIKYDIVTGTSIGSINGLMMVQKDYFKTLWLWINIGFDVVYDTKFPTKYDTLSEMIEIYKQYIKHFLKEGGINTSKISNLINNVFNWKKFSKSKIDYGLITYNFTKKEPLIIKKKDLKKDQVVEYVMASACCYPAFQKAEINGEKYIDGGYYDNMPINLAIEMGAEEIIAVDLDAVGFKKPIVKDNVRVTYIKPRNDIGSFLVFDASLAMRAIKYGYFDTLKKFNKLDGNKYTFRKNDLGRNTNKYNKRFLNEIDKVFDDNNYTELLKLGLFKRFLKTRQQIEISKIFNETIDFLGNLFKIDTCQIYNIRKFNKMLVERNALVEEISIDLIQTKLKNKKFKELFNSSSIVKYLYNLLCSGDNNKELYGIAVIFPKEFIGAIYLKTIK